LAAADRNEGNCVGQAAIVRGNGSASASPIKPGFKGESRSIKTTQIFQVYPLIYTIKMQCALADDLAVAHDFVSESLEN
jgi:hypothetical protein